MTVFQLQKVGAPPAAGAFVKKDAPPTAFRKFYERGDFPIALEHDTKGNKIAWKVCNMLPCHEKEFQADILPNNSFIDNSMLYVFRLRLKN